jgi:hypothetical protein
MKLLGNTNAAFDVIGQRLIKSSINKYQIFDTRRILEKSGSIMAQYISYL